MEWLLDLEHTCWILEGRGGSTERVELSFDVCVDGRRDVLVTLGPLGHQDTVSLSPEEAYQVGDALQQFALLAGYRA